jgi:hypothetical protein
MTQGNTPHTAYMLASSDPDEELTKATIISNGKTVPNNKLYSRIFRNSGRQNDFNYWFDCSKLQSVLPTFQIAFGIDNAYQEGFGSYRIEVQANVSYRYPSLNQEDEKYMSIEEKIKVKEKKIAELTSQLVQLKSQKK